MFLRSRSLGPFQVQSAAATLNHCNVNEFIVYFSIYNQNPPFVLVASYYNLAWSICFDKMNLNCGMTQLLSIFKERSCLNISLSRDVAISGWMLFP